MDKMSLSVLRGEPSVAATGRRSRRRVDGSRLGRRCCSTSAVRVWPRAGVASALRRDLVANAGSYKSEYVAAKAHYESTPPPSR